METRDDHIVYKNVAQLFTHHALAYLEGPHTQMMGLQVSSTSFVPEALVLGHLEP